MYNGPIILPSPIQSQCIAMIILACAFGLFTPDLFLRVVDVRNRLISNNLFIQDLQDLQLLCSAISSYGDASFAEEVEAISSVLGLFIQVASEPVRSCGLFLTS